MNFKKYIICASKSIRTYKIIIFFFNNVCELIIIYLFVKTSLFNGIK